MKSHEERFLFFLILSIPIIYFLIENNEILISYIFIALIIVKSKLLSFIKISLKKIIIYIKTLTLFKAISVAIKRFIIDNYFSKWLDRNIIKPIKPSIIKWIQYFIKLNWKLKIKKVILIVIPAFIITYIGIVTDTLSHIFFYAEIKALVIAFFKFLWIFGDKALNVLYNIFVSSWISPILQIFALAWLIEKIEKIPFVGKYITQIIKIIEIRLNRIMNTIKNIWGKYIINKINKKIRKKMLRVAHILNLKLEYLKYKNEIHIMRQFINKFILKGNPKDYFQNYLKEYLNKNNKFNKLEFYKYHNKQTNDNIDIKAFIGKDDDKNLEDILFIESFSTCNKHGNNKIGLLKNSFWVLNLKNETVRIKVDNKTYNIKPNQIKLIRMTSKQDYNKIKCCNTNPKEVV